MISIRPSVLLRVRRQPFRSLPPARSNATNNNQPPTSAPSGSPPANPHRAFYRSFSRPVAIVFLTAMLTYQTVYLAWLKLESIEEKKIQLDKIHELESELAVQLERRNAGRKSEKE